MKWSDINPLAKPFEDALGAMFGDSDGDTFIDQDTGEEITGAYWACGACGHTPIREGDASCPSCGESVDW